MFKKRKYSTLQVIKHKSYFEPNELKWMKKASVKFFVQSLAVACFRNVWTNGMMDDDARRPHREILERVRKREREQHRGEDNECDMEGKAIYAF